MNPRDIPQDIETAPPLCSFGPGNAGNDQYRRDVTPDRNGWKACSERLPETTEWCLVFADGAIACRAWNETNRQWEDWQGCNAPGVHIDFITHWMSLPDAPTEHAGVVTPSRTLLITIGIFFAICIAIGVWILKG